tara:strand:- start:478 stop:729 length:252 start_codon:yes stop_codon:yes gene_type:complete
MIVIWGKPACPYCDRAKQVCEQREYEFEYKQLGIDFDRDQVLEAFPNARTFPQIVVGGTAVGGYDQFVKYIEDTNYNGTGHSL